MESERMMRLDWAKPTMVFGLGLGEGTGVGVGFGVGVEEGVGVGVGVTTSITRVPTERHELMLLFLRVRHLTLGRFPLSRLLVLKGCWNSI